MIVRVRIAVCVTPPPLAVIVIVRDPVLAVAATLTCIPACPEPGAAMVLGLNVTFTPLPCPDAVNEIAALKPPETAVVIFDSPVAPRATVKVLGESVTVKLPVVPVTVRVTVVVSVVLPEVPVTVMG